MNLAITSRNIESSQQAADKLSSSRNVLALQSEVSSYESKLKAIEAMIKRFGKLDVVIANAGVSHFAPIQDLTAKPWKETVDTNLTGVFNTVKSSINALKESNGYIITLASIAGTNFFATPSAYNASEFGFVGFTQAVMLDLREFWYQRNHDNAGLCYHKCSKPLNQIFLLMTAGELIKLIPHKVFQELDIETKVDAQVKKLSGEVMFKIILFSMLNSNKFSLRVMERFLQSGQFKSFTGYDILEGKYNSIRDRICSINASYFEKLFESIFSIYNKELKEEKALSKTDSTYVALAAKLFMCGMQTGDNDKRFVKYTVNVKGSIPSTFKVFTDQHHVSEDIALSELINETSCFEDNIVVFDRGTQSRSSFDAFTNKRKWL